MIPLPATAGNPAESQSRLLAHLKTSADRAPAPVGTTYSSEKPACFRPENARLLLASLLLMYTGEMHTFFQKDACFLHTSVAAKPSVANPLVICSPAEEKRTVSIEASPRGLLFSHPELLE
jgi:hypothetical protein